MNDLPVTQRQRAVLLFLQQFHSQHSYMPSRREAATALGVKSENAVHDHIEALKRKGMLTTQAGTARAIRLTDAALQLLGDASPRPQDNLIALPVVDMAKVNRRSAAA